MKNEESFQMDDTIRASLEKLLEKIEGSSIIQDYKMIEAKVEGHQGLIDLTEKIKEYQKEAVKCAHYGKPEAEKQAIKQADELTKEFDEHPLVVRYRQRLIEANDLLQHVTNRIEDSVNVHVELVIQNKLGINE